ncbi:hypothetical protein [Nocardia wallacei]|uniref:Uncharacterized protein n=1 Tax=Nocardia wallacei TaxID=480035 RepID=A0A7G1KNQ5_9NOCA|nr:hypothetical protein [Nocardia wallacei]BCK55863.1 hypothetical protein NWFMUON74_36350 [Nocardia wallacei]
MTRGGNVNPAQRLLADVLATGYSVDEFIARLRVTALVDIDACTELLPVQPVAAAGRHRRPD